MRADEERERAGGCPLCACRWCVCRCGSVPTRFRFEGGERGEKGGGGGVEEGECRKGGGKE